MQEMSTIQAGIRDGSTLMFLDGTSSSITAMAEQNYAYIYVNGPSHWVDPSPGPSPMPYPYPYPYPYYYSYDDGPMIYTYSYPSSSQGQPYNPYE